MPIPRVENPEPCFRPDLRRAQADQQTIQPSFLIFTQSDCSELAI
ncbi:MAG: hypothetical protein JWQ08_1579 [Deinococcus sp.]|nr:hypothetical protein [Deinococcus sp.]